MKKVFFLLFSVFMSASIAVNAQEQDKSTGQKIKEGAKKTGSAVKSGAKKVGNKTAELASKGSSKVVDRTSTAKPLLTAEPFTLPKTANTTGLTKKAAVYMLPKINW